MLALAVHNHTHISYFWHSLPLFQDAIITMYEGKLKELNPGLGHIQYDISDLNAYLDTFADVTAMVSESISASCLCKLQRLINFVCL